MKQPVITARQYGDTIIIDSHHMPDANYTVQIYIDQTLAGNFRPAPTIQLPYINGQLLTVVCIYPDGTSSQRVFYIGQRTPDDNIDRDFQPGDLLVASDNYGDFLPPGYMGHTALVVDDSHIIEAVTSVPQVKKSPIDEFLYIHPIHAHYRPINPEDGQNASTFAQTFLKNYQDSINNGEAVPPFSFNPEVPLEDLKTALYCSKLIWHSYYQGSGIAFEDDHFLFAPEDLAAGLAEDDRFELIYRHPDFGFKIDL